MDISLLEEFVSLYETCSFQETAAAMNVSQSTLTKHIHKLEEEMKQSMFDRTGRVVKTNEYSKGFYPYAKDIIRLYREGIETVNSLSKQKRAELVIAYSPVLGQYGIIDIITSFAKKHPEYNPVTIESYQPTELLRQKKCGFAFAAESKLDLKDFNNYNKMIYKRDNLAVVLPKDHPLSDRESVCLEQLYKERFILHSSETDFKHDETRHFLELCDSKGFSPNIVAESQYTSSIVRYVNAGRGIGILNRMHIPKDVPDVVVVDLYPHVYSYIYLVYPQKLSLTSEAQFLHYMIEQINQSN
ncbi:MAG: LysR family transcriptional regulator [Lachnospiraceae bacterium]|nr:LysR family transcriptional regulator [Lachnospiraceae bacterium]